VNAITQLEIDQRIYDLYDEYCHGGIDRRDGTTGLTWRHELTREAVLALLLPPERQRLAAALADVLAEALVAAGGSAGGWPRLAELRLAAGQPVAAATVTVEGTSLTATTGKAYPSTGPIQRVRPIPEQNHTTISLSR